MPLPANLTPDPSVPPTPSEEPLHFTPKRAMASFDNLVALANHQERLREARKIIWRDKGEPVVEMETLRECLEHAGKGGLRSGALAFNIRAAVNLILALIRIRNVPRDHRFALIRHALFGQDTWRFAFMLGTFTSLYKFLINALPILIPSISPTNTRSTFPDLPPPVTAPKAKRDEPKLHLSARAQLLLIRKKTRRWHAALAGAIAGGLAIMWEKRSRRGIISQQMFVRGLQGSYNAFSTRRGFKVPHGDVLVFCLACGQIMYGFLMRPDTLPRSYTSWISQASKVPDECIKMNMGLVRDHKFNMADLDTIVSLKDITPYNKADLLSLRSLTLTLGSAPTSSLTPSGAYYPFYGPCSAVHPAISSCAQVPLDRFFAVFKWMLPIYGALHFVPAVVFRWKRFLDNPMRVFVRALGGSLRSSAFLGGFVVIYQTIFCYKHTLHRILTTSPSLSLYLPQSLINLLISKPSFWILGFLSGLSLFIEEPRRRPELAMYVLPKGLESLWVMLRGKGWVFRTGRWGDVWLTAVGMGMVMDTYQNDPRVLGGLVRRVLYQFIGPN